ncbi:MAG: IS4 family transposase, partial [Pseudomonadota bacterium]
GSLQQELDSFFSLFDKAGSQVQVVTKSAFSQARLKLSYTVFQELNQLIVSYYYQHVDYRQWHGYRVCAVDGCKLRLLDKAVLAEVFGAHRGRNTKKGFPMALVSVYYDVLNKLVIDSSLNPAQASEREAAGCHLAHAGEHDLILFDRGYPAFWLFCELLHRRLAFCMRAKTGLEKIYGEFSASGESERLVEIHPNKRSIRQCRQKGLPYKPIRLRLIRVELATEVEVLVTNLLDSRTFPAGEFKALYQMRWDVEENYKRQKMWAEIDNFSGKSVRAIRQDFFAKVMSLNLTMMFAQTAQDEVAKKTASCKRTYQVNFAQTLSKMKHSVVQLIFEVDRPRLEALIDRLLKYIARTIEMVRKQRKFPRKVSQKQLRLHRQAYKRCL